MFPPKKKKGLDVTIAVGKPKGDLGDPGPLDEEKPSTPSAHEESETPEEEGQEDYGAKLISDIEAAGEKHGIDPVTTKSLAADLFRAMADCLGGGEEQSSEEPQEPGE